MVDNNTVKSSMCRYLYEYMVDYIPGATLNIPVPTNVPSPSTNTEQTSRCHVSHEIENEGVNVIDLTSLSTGIPTNQTVYL